MADTMSFAATSARHSLPLIFPGQVQKELFVNEAHALVDALLHPVVLGRAAVPPAEPEDGDCWIVGPDAAGPWNGRRDMLACRQAGVWLYAQACEGMRVFDRASGADLRFAGGKWVGAASVKLPQGGVAVDVEARAAIGGLVAGLTAAGILPQAA